MHASRSVERRHRCVSHFGGALAPAKFVGASLPANEVDTRLTSSSNTMAFLIIIPANLMAPSNATKLNGTSKASSPAVTPIMAREISRNFHELLINYENSTSMDRP
jgi:hypothetical protein